MRDLDRATASADAAVAELRDWLRAEYLPGAAGTPDGVGAGDRYRIFARRWLGASPDLAEAYEWGWTQYREIMAQMTAEAAKVLPGATPREAMRHLDAHGQIIEGVSEVRQWLQDLMDTAMDQLDGTHFDWPIRCGASGHDRPPGAGPRPCTTPGHEDFARPGRTWLPTMGSTTLPVVGPVHHRYHEGVPGHHLQSRSGPSRRPADRGAAAAAA